MTGLGAAATSEAVSTLAERIAEVRKLLGWSARKWSLDAKVSPGVVGHYESGRRGARPSIVELQALAKVAGVRWEWLLDGSGPRENASERAVDPLAAYPRVLRELLENDDPELGRKNAWRDDTIAALLSMFGDGGLGHLTANEWREAGDKLNQAHDRVARGLAASKVPERDQPAAQESALERAQRKQAEDKAAEEKAEAKKAAKAARAAALVGTPAPKKRGKT